MIEAHRLGLPGLTEVVNKLFLPNELAQLEAAKAVSPGYANLTADVYDTSGRRLNEIGSEIDAANKLATANADLNTIRSTGTDLVKEYNKAAELVDPEYYKTRAALGVNLADLLRTGPELTGGEMSQIERGVNRMNYSSDNNTNKSASNVAAGAMQFGQAGMDKFSRALQLATSAIPVLKSGVDPFMMATGRSSGPNTGDAKFTGAKQGAGGQVTDMSNNLINEIGSTQRAAMDAATRKKSTLDSIGGFAGNLGSFMNIMG